VEQKRKALSLLLAKREKEFCNGISGDAKVEHRIGCRNNRNSAGVCAKEIGKDAAHRTDGKKGRETEE
jgi:hypothetical protein